MCNCEHESHFSEGDAHDYMGVPAGSQRAVYVGPVCDECAQTHMTTFLNAN